MEGPGAGLALSFGSPEKGTASSHWVIEDCWGFHEVCVCVFGMCVCVSRDCRKLFFGFFQ